MPACRASDRIRRPLAVAVMLLVAAGCAGRPASVGGPRLAEWAAGPVGWLMLSDERRRLRRIESSVASVYFIEEFWQRRDPDPTDSANPVREAFHRRVDAADQLYAEKQRRGSLTDRGGALILLGSPSHLHVTSRPVLEWDPREGRGDEVSQGRQSYEVWGYRLEELPPALVEKLRAGGGEEPLRLQLTFVRGRDRTYLTEGRELLALAAEALVAGS